MHESASGKGLLTLERLREAAASGEIETVVVGFTDHYGRLMGKRYDAEVFVQETAADGTNTGWLVADGGLYKLDMATGKAAMVGKIGGLTAPVRDVAALPAM